MQEKNKIILFGDVHGWFGRLTERIRTHHQNSYIIQAGDFGLYTPNRYDSMMLSHLNDVLDEKNCFLYVLRGNHDNPSRFNNLNKLDSDIFSKISFLPDYSELILLDKKILLIGGGISIDRTSRKLNIDYWEDENVSYDPNFPYRNDYDLVVTHSCPLRFDFKKNFKDIQQFIAADETLMKDIIQERIALDEIYKRTKPKHWIFGHFHESYASEFEATKVRCLDELEDYCFHSNISPFHV